MNFFLSLLLWIPTLTLLGIFRHLDRFNLINPFGLWLPTSVVVFGGSNLLGASYSVRLGHQFPVIPQLVKAMSSPTEDSAHFGLLAYI